MRVLVTNDDGVDAVGLAVLARALADGGHDVVVAAPSSDRSGSGSSLGTIEDGAVIPTREVHIDALDHVRVVAMDCPPALIAVAFCAGAYGAAPDLVVSGVNDGHNTGRSIVFSSTVGAVLAAGVAGVGGLAVSCGFGSGSRPDTAAAVAARLIDWMGATGSTRLSLNVNVPDVSLDELRGIRVTSLAVQSMFSLQLDHTDTGLHIGRTERREGFRRGTDSAAVADGFVSVSALRGVASDADVIDDPGALEAVALVPGSAHLR